jgi:hypothetical protein
MITDLEFTCLRGAQGQPDQATERHLVITSALNLRLPSIFALTYNHVLEDR